MRSEGSGGNWGSLHTVHLERIEHGDAAETMSQAGTLSATTGQYPLLRLDVRGAHLYLSGTSLHILFPNLLDNQVL